MTISAIETRYAGCRFRSRLEARWAVFFDHLGIAWEYEPQGFNLRSGRYLPDFWLSDFDAWFEVKGVEPSDQANQLINDLAAAGNQIYIAWGPMPRTVDCNGRSSEPRRIDSRQGTGDATWVSGDIDMAFCACPWCEKIGIEYEGRSARICGWKAHHSDYAEAERIVVAQGHWRADDKCYTADDPRILAAYMAARSSRFEHGEAG